MTTMPKTMLGVIVTPDGVTHAVHVNYRNEKFPHCDVLAAQYVHQEIGTVTCIECLAYVEEDWIRVSPDSPLYRMGINPRREYKWDSTGVYADKKK